MPEDAPVVSRYYSPNSLTKPNRHWKNFCPFMAFSHLGKAGNDCYKPVSQRGGDEIVTPTTPVEQTDPR